MTVLEIPRIWGHGWESGQAWLGVRRQLQRSSHVWNILGLSYESWLV